MSEEEKKCSVKEPLIKTNKELKFHALLFIFLLRAALQHVAWSLGTLPECIADAKAGRQKQSEPLPGLSVVPCDPPPQMGSGETSPSLRLSRVTGK